MLRGNGVVVHKESSEISQKMGLSAKVVNGKKTLTTFANSSILDIYLGSKHASGIGFGEAFKELLFRELFLKVRKL